MRINNSFYCGEAEPVGALFIVARTRTFKQFFPTYKQVIACTTNAVIIWFDSYLNATAAVIIFYSITQRIALSTIVYFFIH